MMKREELINKWLKDELTEAETKAFEKLEDHDAIVKISNKAKLFKSPDYGREAEIKRLEDTIKHRKRPVTLIKKLQPYLQVAAVAVIGFGIYFLYLLNAVTMVHTLASEKTTITLPDASTVVINASSEVRYDEKKWDRKREIKLDGEAFFKVAKGSRFDVRTDAGTVSVLGTRFNVKNRTGYFEVICFEGLVGVEYKGTETKLPAGESFRVMNGTVMKNITEQAAPSWTNNLSTFKSVAFGQVLAELQRQYDIRVVAERVDTEQLFTGSFTHTDKELALQSVTLPMDLTYNIENNTIRLRPRE